MRDGNPKHLTREQREADSLRASKLMARLSAFAEAKPPAPDAPPEEHLRYKIIQMTPGQVQAAQVVLKKLVPDLSAVEQTTVDERDQMSEAQILTAMSNLIATNPDIASKLRALLTPHSVPQLNEPRHATNQVQK